MDFNLFAGNLHSAISDMKKNQFIHVRDGKILRIGDIGNEVKDIESLDYKKQK